MPQAQAGYNCRLPCRRDGYPLPAFDLSLPILIVTCSGLLVGTLIGSIGVGGVLMVPVLIYLAGIDIHIAIASCMFSYAFNGLVGAWLYQRSGSINWRDGGWLCLGAMPGAILGAWLVLQLPAQWLVLIIALFIGFAAFTAWRQPATVAPPLSTQPAGTLLAAGAITGTGSALSGSGGPLLLMPLLVWLRWPILGAIGLGQLIQIPISLLATITNLRYGHIDLALGLLIAMSVTAGVAIGARLAHKLPALVLRRLVISALLLIAGWMLSQALWDITHSMQSFAEPTVGR